MRDVREERRNFPLRIVGGAGGAELRVGLDGLKEGGAGIESFSRAARRCLVSNPIEETISYNSTDSVTSPR